MEVTKKNPKSKLIEKISFGPKMNMIFLSPLIRTHTHNAVIIPLQFQTYHTCFQKSKAQFIGGSVDKEVEKSTSKSIAVSQYSA